MSFEIKPASRTGLICSVTGCGGRVLARGYCSMQIKVNGKNRGLGHFSDERSAALAWDAAALELYGEFAQLNFPEGANDGLAKAS